MRLYRTSELAIGTLVLLVASRRGSSTPAVTSCAETSTSRWAGTADRRFSIHGRKRLHLEVLQDRETGGAATSVELARLMIASCGGGADVELPRTQVGLRDAMSRWHGPLKISVLFLLSYMCSIAFNISNKQALLLVPLPWTYAALNLAIGGGMGLVSWGVKAAPWPKVNLADLWELTPMALLHAVAHMTFVLGLGKGAVSFLQTIKAAEACFTSLVSFVVQGQVLPLPVYLSLLPVVAGVGIVSFNQPRFSWVALLAALASNVTTALRNVLIAHKIGPAAARRSPDDDSRRHRPTCHPSAERFVHLKGGGTSIAEVGRRRVAGGGGLVALSSGDTFRLLTLMSAVLTFPIAALFEGGYWPRLWRGALDIVLSRQARRDPAALLDGASVVAASMPDGNLSGAIRHAVVSAVTFNLFYVLCFRLLGDLHPVTHAVGNTFKRVFIIGASTLVFGGDMGGARGILGTTLSIIGVLGYSIVNALCKARSAAVGQSEK